jgi:cell wall assembly regulator SMI1
VLPQAQFGSLPACIEHYRFRRHWAEEDALGPADDWWHPLWFPILPRDGGIVIAADLATGDADTAPLREIDWQAFGSDHFARIVARSLGDYVLDALDAIDAGEYTYDNHLKMWHHRPR